MYIFRCYVSLMVGPFDSWYKPTTWSFILDTDMTIAINGFSLNCILALQNIKAPLQAMILYHPTSQWSPQRLKEFTMNSIPEMLYCLYNLHGALILWICFEHMIHIFSIVLLWLSSYDTMKHGCNLSLCRKTPIINSMYCNNSNSTD